MWQSDVIDGFALGVCCLVFASFSRLWHLVDGDTNAVDIPRRGIVECENEQIQRTFHADATVTDGTIGILECSVIVGVMQEHREVVGKAEDDAPQRVASSLLLAQGVARAAKVGSR